jgi:putative transposase
MVICRRGKPDALLHHSDRGSQYTSEQFQKLMADCTVVCSMCRSWNLGQCGDGELLLLAQNRALSAQDLSDARRSQGDVFDYIERFCDTPTLDNRLQ